MVLRGEVVEQEDLSLLRRRIQKLESERNDAQREAREARLELAQVRRSLAAIERFLEPFYKGLRGLFEEFDAASVGNEQAVGLQPAPSNPKWESWKQRLSGKAPEFIDLLLVHGEMTAAQLTAAAHCSKKTTYDTIYKMNKAGITSKNGKNFSLR